MKDGCMFVYPSVIRPAAPARGVLNFLFSTFHTIVRNVENKIGNRFICLYTPLRLQA